jgi:predicted DNA-binding protein
MDKKESKSEDINIRLTPFLKEQYKKYCKENNIDMSKHIREFIEKEINKCKS